MWAPGHWEGKQGLQAFPMPSVFRVLCIFKHSTEYISLSFEGYYTWVNFGAAPLIRVNKYCIKLCDLGFREAKMGNVFFPWLSWLLLSLLR